MLEGDHRDVQRGDEQQQIEGESEYWYQVSYEGVRGWAFGAYIGVTESRLDAAALLDAPQEAPRVSPYGDIVHVWFAVRSAVDRFLSSDHEKSRSKTGTLSFLSSSAWLNSGRVDGLSSALHQLVVY